MLLLRNQHQPAWFSHLFDGSDFEPENQDFSATKTTLPSVNIKENDSEFNLEFAAPGFEKADFKIELDDDNLTVSSEKKLENETGEGESFVRREFSYQSFSRSFTLPETADSEKIEANYGNGILTVTIPKKEEAKPKPARVIEIK